jgi:hypothetical protein
VKDYDGTLVWRTYWGVYVGTLGGLFLGIQSGMVNPFVILGSAAGGGQSSSVASMAAAFLLRHAWLASHSLV